MRRLTNSIVWKLTIWFLLLAALRRPGLGLCRKAMVIGLKPLNKTMAWSAENDVEDREKAAVNFLQNYEDRWRSWVTPEARRKRKDALEKAVSEGH